MIELPRSTFYYQASEPAAALSDLQVVQLIASIPDELAGYGYRRVTHELRRRGHLVNHKRIARLMKLHGLGIKPRRRFVRTTDSDHDSPIFPGSRRTGNTLFRPRSLLAYISCMQDKALLACKP